MATTLDTTRFDHLLTTWNRHEDLRATNPELTELFASRAQLDDARLLVRRSN